MIDNREDIKTKYVDLKTNGRLFPIWMMSNFKKFKLPERIVSNDDPCQQTRIKLELKKYQVFLSKYLDYNSPYTDLLIYHGLGSGKTATAINIYNMLYNYTPGWNVFILLRATLKNHPWMSELQTWLSEDEKKYRMDNIIFISYDSPIADKSFMEAIQNADASKKSLYIIEEAHNFMSNVYSNIVTKKGRRAQTIYDYIIHDKKENPGVRVILLSGTPAINHPFELALLFNLLRPGIFPKSETEFNQIYVSNASYPTISNATKNNFQRRILGLVSYYIGATPDYFASKRTHFVDIVMSKYQSDIYKYFENIEAKMIQKSAQKMQHSEVYRSYTRQSSNFVFPLMTQGMTAETRPRPHKFELSAKVAENIDKDKIDIEDIKKSANMNNYYKAMLEFYNTFDNFLNEKRLEDNKNKENIQEDIQLYFDKYKENYTEFIESPDRKSKLLDTLYNCSAKMLLMCLNIIKSAGPVLVYSNYVLMEGLQIFKLYLKYVGFADSFIEYHGGIDVATRGENLKRFNNPDNKYGKLIKVILISPAGAEGINLANVRQVHIMEPYWHEVRITQMIGRAIRQCSHKDLPKNERHVDIYRYKSVLSDPLRVTTDQHIENVARSKDGLIQSFLDAMKEAAIDCELNKADNMLMYEYSCFKFDEQLYFDANIGPAYKQDLYDDLKMNIGSNSINSIIKRIKVIKISAVKLLSNPAEKVRNYSIVENYWYNPQTTVVYDFDLHFPLGKIWTDNDNIPIKLNESTYIIDKIIPIPTISS
jgi:superfamily II DNA or RNA helicase